MTRCALSHSAPTLLLVLSLAAFVTTATAVLGGGDHSDPPPPQILLTFRQIAVPSTLAAELAGIAKKFNSYEFQIFDRFNTFPFKFNEQLPHSGPRVRAAL